MTAAVPLLEVHGFTRRFGGLTAVDNVDLDVAQGEFVSIIGPNGAGKTTLFNLVTGLDQPHAGTARLDGRDITRMAAERLATLGLARTFQHGRVFANLSVLDNVLVGAHVRFKAVRPSWPGPLFLSTPGGIGARPGSSRLCRRGGKAPARRGDGDPEPLRRPVAAAQEQSCLQPFLRQSATRRDRPRAGARPPSPVARRAHGRHEPDRDGGDAGPDRRNSSTPA